jgi:hypothetical protein
MIKSHLSEGRYIVTRPESAAFDDDQSQFAHKNGSQLGLGKFRLLQYDREMSSPEIYGR